MTDTADVIQFLPVNGSDRHPLPSGGWVALRNQDQLRARDHKRLTRCLNADDGKETGIVLNDELMCITITAWSLPYPPTPAPDGSTRDWVIPAVDPTMVDDLSIRDYHAMVRLMESMIKLFVPDKPDPSDHEDPASPSEPADA